MENSATRFSDGLYALQNTSSAKIKKTADVIMTTEVEARMGHQFQIIDEMDGLFQENYFGIEWDSRTYNSGPAQLADLKGTQLLCRY